MNVIGEPSVRPVALLQHHERRASTRDALSASAASRPAAPCVCRDATGRRWTDPSLAARVEITTARRPCAFSGPLGGTAFGAALRVVRGVCKSPRRLVATKTLHGALAISGGFRGSIAFVSHNDGVMKWWSDEEGCERKGHRPR